jgi:hypothetical protein
MLSAIVTWGAVCQPCSAFDLILADGRTFPGELWLSRSSASELLILKREATANPAYPKAAMKVGAVAATIDGKIFFASGLDGYVMHLLDQRHEILSFEFDGQIRDLACTDEPHTIYFSVVPTPQNGAPLADGKIYRRDLWAGAPSEVATVRQSQIGGNWWGTFAIQNGVTYLATLENPSRIIKLSGAGPEVAFTAAGYKIDGLAAGEADTFFFTDGSDHVYRTVDFQTVESMFHGQRTFTDVAVESGASAN